MTRALHPTRVVSPPTEVPLHGGGLRASVRPDLGAKVTELATYATGRDWLWHNERLPHRPGSHGASYIRDFDSGGWDELFPTIAAMEPGAAGGVWNGMALTDHGEVWCRRWTIEERAVNACRVACESGEPGYRLERTIRLGPSAPELTAEYGFENRSDRAMSFVWAAHPIFELRAGMALHVPRAAPVVIETINGQKPGRGEVFARWADLQSVHPIFESGRPLDTESVASGLIAKVFVRVTENDGVALSDGETGERMLMTPTDDALPYIAVWLNLAGWAGDGGAPLTNIGIEPTTSAHETLPCERDPKGGRSSEPGEKLSWAFRIRFDS